MYTRKSSDITIKLIYTIGSTHDTIVNADREMVIFHDGHTHCTEGVHINTKVTLVMYSMSWCIEGAFGLT